ncbi:MAG TPA: GNAT family N-acetyltransferase [Chitinophagaceae bacterium]|nr:GNAT family N-acetyltransferase [Chitinophagaceae bacterium]
MISENIHFLPFVRGSTLDRYLAAGWYRIYDFVFTTDSISVGSSLFTVEWLRYELEKFEPTRRAAKLLKRNERVFSICYRGGTLTGEHELLYERYRLGVDLELAPTARQSLYAGEPSEIFESRVIELRLKRRLVGAGFFDVGDDSAAGILNIYDPEFKKYSPGKFLMLLAMRYALRSGRKYFYPGYISRDYPKFDYKLFAGTRGAEIYDRSANRWIPIERWPVVNRF